MRLGIIGSSGGAALASAIDCLKSAGKEINLFVVADRHCGLLSWAEINGHSNVLINYSDTKSFSVEALSYFRSHDVKNVLLFYTRVVSTPLISDINVYNIHPSLLPSFKGLHAVRDALLARSRILGATLHAVDEGLDTGNIIAQIATALPVNVNDKTANKMSYLQKVYLTLLFYELIEIEINADYLHIEDDYPIKINCSPSIKDTEVLNQYQLLQNREDLYVI